MRIGKKLYELRTAQNLSQEELANKLEVSRQSVSKWETDAAMPDLDKLIKLCDTFHVSLDELTGRISPCEEVSTNAVKKAEQPSLHQKVIGYILLAVSLIAAVLIVLLAKEEVALIMTALITATVFACSLVCLFFKKQAGYWCAWIAFTPFMVISPFVVSLHVFRYGALIQLGWYTLMGCFAKNRFGRQAISANRRRVGLLVTGWILTVGVWVWMHMAIVNAMLTYTVTNILVYAAIACLLTGTVSYVTRKKEE